MRLVNVACSAWYVEEAAVSNCSTMPTRCSQMKELARTAAQNIGLDSGCRETVRPALSVPVCKGPGDIAHSGQLGTLRSDIPRR